MNQEKTDHNSISDNVYKGRISSGAPIGKKKRAIQFEQKIKSFLENLKFENVDGARDNFLINGIQVDVCAGWEDTLFIIECKSAEELKTKSLRSEIFEFRGKLQSLLKGFDEHPLYKNYSHPKMIIVTKNIDVRKEDIDLAKQDPHVYIWDEDFIDYYQDLYSYLDNYAKYDLLGELGVKPHQRNTISVAATLTKIGNTEMYNFILNPKDLLSVAFVARREKRKERYYQRIIDKNRLKKIASYIDNNGVFPNNIIIAFDEHLNINFHPIKTSYSATDFPFINFSFGILEFPRDYRSCWIIDGQHRLYAFVQSKKSFNMPITAFANMDIEKQGRLFLDINKNQKPVPSDLLWDLNGNMIPSERDGIISNVVKTLNTDKNSPLYYKIYYPSTGIKKDTHLIKISAMCDSIKKRRLVVEHTSNQIKNPFFYSDQNFIVKHLSKSLSDYFNMVKKILNENWNQSDKGFVLTNGGNSVMIGLFEKIVERSMQKNKRAPSEEDFELYLTPMKSLFEKKYNNDSKQLKSLRLKCSSEGGKEEVLENFIRVIKAKTADDQFGGEIQTTKFMQEFNKLEMKMKKLIYYTFYNPDDKEWFKNSVVDKSIYDRALKKIKRNGITDINQIYMQILFGECFSIMRVHKEKFYKYFIGDDIPCKFINNSVFEGQTSLLTSLRGKCEAHYTSSQMSEEDEQMLQLVLEKMNGCLDYALDKFKIASIDQK